MKNQWNFDNYDDEAASETKAQKPTVDLKAKMLLAKQKQQP